MAGRLVFRKAYSAVGVLLLLEFLAQLFFVGVAVFTVNGGQPDSETSIYAAFQSSEIWFILHGVTGLLVVSVTILALIALLLLGGIRGGRPASARCSFSSLLSRPSSRTPRCHRWSPASTQ